MGGVLEAAPRGGLREEFAGQHYSLILRNSEIERFEDLHRGVFDLWDGFFRHGSKPSVSECRDLLSLGFVGGGLAEDVAATLVGGLSPAENHRIYAIAQGLLGVAFMPDSVDGGGDEPDPDASAKAGEGDEKKT